MKKIYSILAIVAVVTALFLVSIFQAPSSAEEADDTSSDEPTVEESTTFSFDEWNANRPKVKGIYVTAPTAGTERIDEIIQLINETELNTIVIDVKDDHGNITFDMDLDNELAKSTCVPYISDIDALMKKLKDNNIYVIARIPCFKDPALAEARPDLALSTYSGDPVTDKSGNRWINPCNEEVWDYIIDIAEACGKYGFDEIQFDYVRFPVTDNSDEANYGKVLTDGDKQQYILSFLQKATDALHEDNLPVTADVFGIIIKSQLDASNVGQDYTKLADTLDGLCPMIYPSHYANGEFGLEVPDAAPYETIYAAMCGSKSKLANASVDKSVVIRPWLQAFTASWVDGYIEYDGAAIRKQIQGVYDSGYDEWILWNSKSNYTAEGLEKKF